MSILENLESDYFSKNQPRLSIIRNLNNQVLVYCQENLAVFEDMTDSECEGIFKIYLQT